MRNMLDLCDEIISEDISMNDLVISYSSKAYDNNTLTDSSLLNTDISLSATETTSVKA